MPSEFSSVKSFDFFSIQLTMKEKGGYTMHFGSVIWFNDSKGYGLIEAESGQTVFVHYSSIQTNGFRSLKQGQKVEFDLYEDEAKGYLARNVVSC